MAKTGKSTGAKGKSKKGRHEVKSGKGKKKSGKKKAGKKKAGKKKRTARVAKPKQLFNIFIAWSGEDGRVLGTSLSKRLKTIIPRVRVLFSPDFNPGAAWASRVQASIRNADYSIICVTKNSLDSRWLNFETGAAWKSMRQGNVCPLLLDIEPDELKGPLELFQARQFVRADFESLCKFFAKKTKTKAEVVKDNFDAVWPGMESEIKGPRKP